MKTKILIAAVMFLALSAAAFAQATFQVSSVPVTTVASCGAAELTGDVIFTTVAGTGSTGAGTSSLVLTYNVPVVSKTLGTALQVFVNGVESATDEAAATVSGSTVTIPVSEAITVGGQSIRVSGVRANVAGSGVSSVTVSVTASGNPGFAFVGGQTNLTVVSSVSPALKALTTTAINVTAATGVAAAAGNIKVQENFINAFNTAGTVGAGNQGQILQLTFSSIPTGLTLTLPTAVSSTGGDVFTLVDLTVSSQGAVTTATAASAGVLAASSTPVSAFYELTSAVASNSLKTVNIPVTAAKTATATLPIPLSTVNVTANLAPQNVAPATGVTGMSFVPRYGGDLCLVGPTAILNVVSARTPLLIPYALFVQNAFDTGMAIANTTSDPGATAMSLSTNGAATKQDGGVTFYFFGQTGITGTPTSFATTASGAPGSGLNASGLVASGSTYVVGLGELLTKAGFTGTFWQGYIIAVCDFTNGHGQYFIGNNSSQGATGWEQGALMLVIPTSRAATESLGN